MVNNLERVEALVIVELYCVSIEQCHAALF